MTSSLPGYEKRTVQVDLLEHPINDFCGVINVLSKEYKVLDSEKQEQSWYHAVQVFLEKGKLPEREETRLLLLKAARYTMINKVPSLRGVGNVYLRCLTQAEAQKIIDEMLEGSRSMHLIAQTLAGKIKNQGFY